MKTIRLPNMTPFAGALCRSSYLRLSDKSVQRRKDWNDL